MSTLTNYNGLDVVTPAPMGAGGFAINRNFQKLSTKIAATDPSATDDSTEGYGIGSRWFNSTTNTEFLCTDATTSAAVWAEIVANPFDQSLNTTDSTEFKDLELNVSDSSDPCLSFNVATVGGWSVGLDNSDSDKLKIDQGNPPSPGSNTKLTIDTTGKIGVGTSTPSSLITVQASPGTDPLSVFLTTAASAFNISQNGDASFSAASAQEGLVITGNQYSPYASTPDNLVIRFAKDPTATYPMGIRCRYDGDPAMEFYSGSQNYADNIMKMHFFVGGVGQPSGKLGLVISPDGNVLVGNQEWPGSTNLFQVYGNAAIGTGYYTSTAPSNGLLVQGNVGIGTTSPSAALHLKEGTTTASSAPLKFSSGSLLTTAETGAIEFLTDDFYATITTGAARKGFVLNDGSNLTSGRVPFATTNGRLTDDSSFTFSTSTGLATTKDVKLNVTGNGLYIKEGSNATMGTVTLSAGSATVSTTKVTANSRIFLTMQSLGTVTIPQVTGITARTVGTSFTITSAANTDTSIIAWLIMEPA